MVVFFQMLHCQIRFVMCGVSHRHHPLLKKIEHRAGPPTAFQPTCENKAVQWYICPINPTRVWCARPISNGETKDISKRRESKPRQESKMERRTCKGMCKDGKQTICPTGQERYGRRGWALPSGLRGVLRADKACKARLFLFHLLDAAGLGRLCAMAAQGFIR